MLFTRIRVGDELPNVRFAELGSEGTDQVKLRDLAFGKTIVLFSIVGAYVPACSRNHVPGIIANAPRLLASGFHGIYCVMPNDPWVVSIFAAQFGQKPAVRFLSDGNLQFAYTAGLTFEGTDMFLGRRSHRFMIIAKNGIVQKLSVEDNPTVVSCTAASTIGTLDAQ